MSILKAFRGLRPRPDIVEKVASLPYDVMNSQEAKEMAKGNPESFLHVIKPEIDLNFGIGLYDDSVYAKAKENFNKMIDDGILIQDDSPCIYIYEQQMGDHTQRGLIGCASIDDYHNNVIKKHELTRKIKEDDRTKHVKELNANAGPAFLTYKANNEIDRILEDFTSNNDPEYNFIADDGIRHTLWIIKNNNIVEKISGIFKDTISALYIADGHHRSASAARVGLEKRKEFPDYSGDEEFNYFLAVYFPHNQLKILDYNRVVLDLNELSTPEFIEKLKEKFDVTEYTDKNCYSPEKTHTFGMYIDKKWYRLEAKNAVLGDKNPVESLDVSILQKNVLTPLLAIKDPRTDERIHFVGGIRGLSELQRLVDSGEFKVAFAMYPTTIEELMAIADAGLLMPPKSTWFEPKLRSGMVVHLLD